MTNLAPPSTTDPVLYAPTPFFRFAALLFVAGAAVLAFDVWRTPEPIAMILFVGVAVVAFAMTLGAFARAEIDADTLTYTVPLRPQRRMTLGQIEHVEIVGRVTRALLVEYRPGGDTTETRFLNMVPLSNQSDLFVRLGGKQDDDD